MLLGKGRVSVRQDHDADGGLFHTLHVLEDHAKIGATAADGQDGGNDYFRGSCLYVKTLKKSDLPVADHYYLEIRGANSSADVYAGGKKLAHHDGGYSTWRVELTEALGDETDVAVVVDNSPSDTVYPQMADFTFYGGLYRSVNLVAVNDSHFALDYYGGTGLVITPTVEGKDARVEVEVFVKNFKAGQKLVYTLYDKEENALDRIEATDTKVAFEIKDVHLWHGRRDPYLYCCEVEIVEGEEVLDNVCSRFGCRSFQIDPENGFILNGEEYPLRGVSRHQDRLGVGNALLPEHHEQDIDLIMEVGATTIRLAHYQHDQYFYDLCDEKGLVTMDRAYKKDAFYAYKAWLSDDPFVHLCGKRYVDRVEDVTRVTVYSNQPEVELFVNGESIGKKSAPDHFFCFDVKNEGETTIVAKAGDLTDEGKIRKVAERNMDYVLREVGAVLNWFDVTEIEGRYSLNDKISDIMKSKRGMLWFVGMGLKIKKKMDANKKGDKAGDKKSGGFDVDLSGGNMGGMMEMLGGFSVLRLSSMMGMMGVSFTKEELLKMNKQLNRIKKPKNK